MDSFITGLWSQFVEIFGKDKIAVFIGIVLAIIATSQVIKTVVRKCHKKMDDDSVMLLVLCVSFVFGIILWPGPAIQGIAVSLVSWMAAMFLVKYALRLLKTFAPKLYSAVNGGPCDVVPETSKDVPG